MSRRSFEVESIGLGVIVTVRVDYADTATTREVGHTVARAYAASVTEHKKRDRTITDRRALPAPVHPCITDIKET